MYVVSGQHEEKETRLCIRTGTQAQQSSRKKRRSRSTHEARDPLWVGITRRILVIRRGCQHIISRDHGTPDVTYEDLCGTFLEPRSRGHRGQVIRARARLSYLCFSIGMLMTLSTLSFPVHAGSSDLTVDSIWLERASAPHVPVAGTDLALNESFNIVAGIKNLGQEAANGYYLDVYYDNDYGRGGPDNIASGEAQEWYLGPLTATAGTHTTQWVVDPDNQIAELNEQNNVKQYTFTVGSSPIQTTNASTTTVTATVIQNATSYSYGTTIATVTSYSTSASTSTIPTVTTVVLVPLTVASTVQGTQILTSTLTRTVTSYTGTSTSTIPTLTTVALVPFTTTLAVQNTQYVTPVLTTTVTSYTGTQALTSTIVVPTTITLAPLAATSTARTTQVQTSTGTTTETRYATMTTTSYTDTSASTSARVVYTTSTSLASAGVSSPLTYLGFMSLLAVTFVRVMVGKGMKIPKARLWMGRRCAGN